ncbi:MAG: hypothetical protein HY900_20645 [Deltaproteobacteria bacterium]|nr:hypothetical protein [Deltaproteobacteria bacterium]
MATIARMTHVRHGVEAGLIPFFFKRHDVAEYLAEFPLTRADGSSYISDPRKMLNTAVILPPGKTTRNKNRKFLRRFRDSSGEFTYYMVAGE